MKKIEINYKSYFANEITMTICFLWVIAIFITPYIWVYETEIYTIVLYAILLIVSVFGLSMTGGKITVEYDIEKVHWEWRGFEHTVNFSDIDSVYYTIIHERRRYGGYNHRFEMIFKLKNDEELILNDYIELKDIDNSISGTPDDIKLMQLYRLIEAVCPEKCTGFVKDNDIF